MTIVETLNVESMQSDFKNIDNNYSFHFILYDVLDRKRKNVSISCDFIKPMDVPCQSHWMDKSSIPKMTI